MNLPPSRTNARVNWKQPTTQANTDLDSTSSSAVYDVNHSLLQGKTRSPLDNRMHPQTMLAKNQLCLAHDPDRATGLDSPRDREVPDPEDVCISTVTHAQPVPTAQPSTGYPPRIASSDDAQAVPPTRQACSRPALWRRAATYCDALALAPCRYKLTHLEAY